MFTVVKQNSLGETKIQYIGELLMQLTCGVVIQASWTLPARDLGYTVFEPGDQFKEYYYTDRWFNIFEITRSDGTRKGWYCNVAEPAHIYVDRIVQKDLLLDVWINSQGEPLILDEDEFAADTTLTDEQRVGAHHGLQAVLHLLTTRQEVFAKIGAT